MAAKMMSQAAFAEHRGVSPKTVTIWKSKGLLVMDGRLVHFRATDLLLDARPEIYRGGKASVTPSTNGAEHKEPELDFADAINWSLAEAQRKKEIALALTRQLAYEKARGSVIALPDVQITWGRIVTGLRNTMLSVPNKLRMALPHLSVGDTETVRDVIRDVLTQAALERGYSGDPPDDDE